MDWMEWEKLCAFKSNLDNMCRKNENNTATSELEKLLQMTQFYMDSCLLSMQ